MKVKIGMEIRALSKYIGRYLNSIQIQYDITGPQGLILIYIYQSEKDVYQKDIEKFFNIRRSSATGLITSLEEKEYITRESVASDARLKKLILTDKAKNAVSLVDEQVIDLEEKMMQGISEEEIEFFRKIIAKMTKNLLKKKMNDNPC